MFQTSVSIINRIKNTDLSIDELETIEKNQDNTAIRAAADAGPNLNVLDLNEEIRNITKKPPKPGKAILYMVFRDHMAYPVIFENGWDHKFRIAWCQRKLPARYAPQI